MARHHHPLVQCRVVTQLGDDGGRREAPRIGDVSCRGVGFVEVNKLPAVGKAHMRLFHRTSWPSSAVTGTTCRSPTCSARTPRASALMRPSVTSVLTASSGAIWLNPI